MPDAASFWAVIAIAAIIVGAAIVERIRHPAPLERHRRRQGPSDGGDPDSGSCRNDDDGSDGGGDGGDGD